MKKTTLLIAILLWSVQTYSQVSPTTGRAAIVHSKFRVANSNGIPNDTNAITTIQYFDGLGNQIQTIGYKQSPSGTDIVQNTTQYDKHLRPAKNYLPFAVTNGTGAYQTGVQTTASGFYGDAVPYEEITKYDRSPLDRERVSRGTGEAWKQQNKTRSIVPYVGLAVKRITVDGSGNLIFNSQFYGSNKLWVEAKTDEQGSQTITATDSEGKKILTKDALGNITTYVYDHRDRLAAIIQPKGYDFGNSIAKDSDIWQKYVFGFEYDLRNRIIRKHTPGAGYTLMIYDKADRLVMQQDALQGSTSSPSGSKWNFWKYDAFDREVFRGETVNANSQATLQAAFNTHATPNEVWSSSGGYNGGSFPSIANPSSDDVQHYTFYDQYDFVTLLNTNLAFDATNAYHAKHTSAKGLQTGTVAYNQADHSQYFMTAQYYDTKNRPIQSFETHSLSPTLPNRTDFQYNFAGDVLKERAVLRNVNEATKTFLKQNLYDHVGRKTEYKLGINVATPETIAKYYYDAVGRQSTKWLYPNRTYQKADSLLDYINRPPSPAPNTVDLAKRAVNLFPGTVIDTTYLAYIDTLSFASGTVAGMQKMDFGYHIRGLMNCTNCQGNVPSPNLLENDLFANKIEWETAGRFDDNIGKQTWKNRKDNNLRTYSYQYDPSSRMTAANYTGSGNENYSLSQLSFDDNGNILKLKRKGFTGNNFGDIDSLTYAYSGNKLTKIDDAIMGNINTKDFRDSSATIDYTYWPNGNLKSDLNKKISLIEYNTYLNKPKKVTFLSGLELNFNYDGSGTQISRSIPDSTKWQYTPDEIYKDDSLYQISQDEGRITRKAGKYKFEFEYRDIWGNLRTSFADSDSLPVSGVYPAPIVLQINDYDPLGFEHFNNQEGTNNFLFQKQERILDLGLGYDFWKYRYSDAATGRFWMIDPLGSQYAHNSLYAFQENKLGMGVELEGAELAEFGHWISKNIDKALTFTDADDFTVLITTASRGGNGVHVDGIKASTSDKWFAAGGLFLPVVGGGVVKKAIDKVVDLSTAEKRAEKLSKVQRSGKDATKAGKDAVKDVSRAKNDGKTICVTCKTETIPGTKDKKGVTPPGNRTEIDHRTRKREGGSGTPDNLDVNCRDCNQKKH